MSMTKGTPASSQIIFLEQRVTDLEIENERLEAALRPFACKCSVKGEGAGGNCTRGSGECDCWNARAALEATPASLMAAPVWDAAEPARTIEILRVELAKVNMENDRLTRTNRAKREHRDRLLAAKAKDAARIERLEAALRPLACTCKAKHQAECSRSEVDCPFWNARAALEERT